MPDQTPLTAEAEEIRRLRDELFGARLTVIRLMPDPLRRMLETYIRCTSLDEFVRWRHATAQQIISLADARPGDEMGDWANSSPRALCPLCRESSSWQGKVVEGFAVPDGLLRHLFGTQRTTLCAVFEIACALALQHVNSLSGRKETADR